MQALAMQRGNALRPAPLPARRAAVGRVVCSAGKHDDQPSHNQMALPFAALVASTMLMGAMPDEALAARSGARIGGGSGFKARRAASSAAPSSMRSSSTRVYNNSVMVAPPIIAPPLVGGFGYGGGYGYGGGFSIMPTFMMPVPFFGGIMQIFFLVFIISVVGSILRAITSGMGSGAGSNKSNKSNKRDGDDGWGDL